MKTLNKSQQNNSEQMELPLTSLQEDFPVKTSASQGDKKVLKGNDLDSGLNALVCLGTFDQDMPYLRTSGTCSTGTTETGSDRYSGKFPPSGMMLNGTVYQLPRLVPTTKETGSGLWPTATAMTGGEGVAPSHINGKHGWNLGAAVQDSLSPKPHRRWPTPAARDYKGARKPETMAKTGRNPDTNSLPDAVEFRGTPGRLNPTWVEWLMGFPTGHTDLNA